MPARRPIGPDPQRSPRQIQLVIYDYQIPRLHLVLRHQSLPRWPAEIHIRQRLGQQHRLAAYPALTHQRHAFFSRHSDAVSRGHPVHYLKAQVMRRTLVLLAWIPQADDKSGELAHGPLLLLLLALASGLRFGGRALFSLLSPLDPFLLRRTART